MQLTINHSLHSIWSIFFLLRIPFTQQVVHLPISEEEMDSHEVMMLLLLLPFQQKKYSLTVFLITACGLPDHIKIHIYRRQYSAFHKDTFENEEPICN
jgi:hypothetical protein